jgi:pyridoxal 5'-phosphate synthase pdxT subunit
MKKRVGVLALQGGFIEHIIMLRKINNVEAIQIKQIEELKNLDALIIPGGESTSIAKLIKLYKFTEAIKKMASDGKFIWGTCAGLILLARELEGGMPGLLGLIDIQVKRNAFGSQLDSFIDRKIVPAFSSEPIEMVFIRAPIISSTGNNVQIIAKINDNIVAAEEVNILVTSFHPELTENTAVHKYFLNKID